MTAATLLLAPVIAWAQAAPPDSVAPAEAVRARP
jgi:hypothetical protein